MNISWTKDSVSIKKTIMVLIVLMALLVVKTDAKCSFEAIFNFGDSNSDTGGFYSAFPSQPYPNGMTYFKTPTGRPSDGRLSIDFLAQALGLPFISPYLKSIGSDYKHGVNFATSASTVLQPSTSLFVTGVSPFYLAIQLNQMKEFKAKVDWQQGKGNLPSPDIFGKSLYTFNIGQNDFTGSLGSNGIEGVMKLAPQVISQISSTIKELYALGGRTFLVYNMAPIGCYPTFLARFSHGDSDMDASGCMKSYNNAAVQYNNMLKDALSQTRNELKDANVVYFDSHAVLLDLFQNPKSHGLQYGTKACCGYGGGAYNMHSEVSCGYSRWIDGKEVKATACEDPHSYVNWDGMHPTEAANKILAHALLNSKGSYFDPYFSLHNHCDINPIG